MLKLSDDSQTPEPNWLKIEDFELLCFDLAKEFLDYGEPIPDYSTAETSLLESALGSPMQTFDGLLYPTLAKQAAILFYLLIKNHPFKNGNKRIAVMALLVFLHLNGMWLKTKPAVLYTVALEVSNSEAKEKEKVLSLLDKFITDFMIDFPEART